MITPGAAIANPNFQNFHRAVAACGGAEARSSAQFAAYAGRLRVKVEEFHGLASNLQAPTGRSLPEWNCTIGGVTDAALLDHIARLPHARANFQATGARTGRRRAQRRTELETALARLAARGDLIELRSGHYAVTAAQPRIRRRPPQHAPRRLRLPDFRPAHRRHGRATSSSRPNRPKRPCTATAWWCASRASKPAAAPMAKSSRSCKRAHPTVVGEFRIGRRGQYVVPHDDRIQQWIEIPEGMEIPAGRRQRSTASASTAPQVASRRRSWTA